MVLKGGIMRVFVGDQGCFDLTPEARQRRAERDVEHLAGVELVQLAVELVGKRAVSNSSMLKDLEQHLGTVLCMGCLEVVAIGEIRAEHLARFHRAMDVMAERSELEGLVGVGLELKQPFACVSEVSRIFGYRGTGDQLADSHPDLRQRLHAGLHASARPRLAVTIRRTVSAFITTAISESAR